MPLKPQYLRTDAQRTAARVSVMSVAVLLVAVLFIAGLGTVVVSAIKGDGGNSSLAAASGDGPFPAQAELVARAWLTAEPSPIPVSAELDVDMGRDADVDDPTLGFSLGDRVRSRASVYPNAYQYTYNLIPNPGAESPPENGQQLVFNVGNADGNPILLDYPSIIPTNTGAGTATARVNTRALGQTASLGPSGQSAVQNWVAAFTRDNREALSDLTGDPEAGDYIGLSPAGEPGRGTIVGSFVHPTIEGVVVSKVRFQVEYETGGTATLTYLVAVSGLDRAEPFVIAWLPDGSAPGNLTPYLNRAVTVSDADETPVPDGETPASDTTVTTVPSTTAPAKTTTTKKGS